MNRLDAILADKRAEVAEGKRRRSLDDLDRAAAAAPSPRGFARALDSAAVDGFALIAEIKRRSPSKGLIRADFDPAAHARAYADGGAACLSVLTDAPHFGGGEADLRAARAAVSLPVLRKDFTLEPWQVAEARAMGADAVLLIVAALDDAALAECAAAAAERGLDVLVEVHDAAELDRALALGAALVGVNNRDLRDFSVDLGRTEALAARVPATTTLVAESGLTRHDDLVRLAAAGIRRFLVGEALMREADLRAATTRLLTGA